MAKDVLITPASGLVDFKDSSGNSDATIQLDDLGNLNITNPAGTLTIGNTAANLYIGDGTNSVDIIFEQNGKIRALTNKTLTLGQSDSFIRANAPIDFVSPDGTKTITARMLNTDVLSFQGGAGELLSLNDSMSGTIFSVNDVSGIPSIEVLDTGTIKLAQYSGNVGIGTASPSYKLDVNGSANTGALTATSFSGNGSGITNLNASNLSGTVPSAVLGNSTHYIGTTAIALNRASASQALTGITSIDGTATNITAYTINQNLGTANTPNFAGVTLTTTNPTAATGVVPSFVTMNGGRGYIGYDLLNSQPYLYETRFVNVGASTNIPSGMAGMGYWFGMGAGDASPRGFSLMGTSGSGLWYKEHSGNSWYRLLDTSNYSTYASPLAGSSSLTTTGTVTSGTWSGSFGAVSGANLTNLNASNLSSGIVSTARLGTGTASSTTYLAGDNTWKTISGGASITDDTTTNATRYIVFGGSTSGAMTTAYVSSSKLYFNPSTGVMSATIFNSLSDISRKTDVINITNSIDIVNQLQGVEFNWADNGNKSSGVIAQDVEEVLPHLVHDSEGIKSVNYSGLIGYLIESIKELNARIVELENK